MQIIKRVSSGLVSHAIPLLIGFVETRVKALKWWYHIDHNNRIFDVPNLTMSSAKLGAY
ncbi:MAG: hypothetical protein GX316_10385 [Firmicutes bacterium]|nr:hypothetical protein [Bacillota bacterium]